MTRGKSCGIGPATDIRRYRAKNIMARRDIALEGLRPTKNSTTLFFLIKTGGAAVLRSKSWDLAQSFHLAVRSRGVFKMKKKHTET